MADTNNGKTKTNKTQHGKRGDFLRSEEGQRLAREGREQANAIAAYLDALNASTAKPRKRIKSGSDQRLAERLTQVEALLSNSTDASLYRVALEQERIDIQAELSARNDVTEAPDPSLFVEGFVKSVGDYSLRKGLTKQAWRRMGVPADVLRQAGF